MAIKKNITSSEDILVKIDQNNLIYIDPNSVLSDGKVLQRQVEPENLVMYVNLEADLIPRTTLISSQGENTLISIADGMLSFVQKKDGGDFDTKWTDSFFEYTEKKDGEFYQNDKTGQSFGITQIKIDIKGMNFVPRIDINFTDVRGKTLFESPENSPYKAFFHLPWPIFYLTVKGYYGKPIKYRLHMVSFNSKLNSSNGNFDINTTFVGSTFAYLVDIPLEGILNAPYMFSVPYAEKGKYNDLTKTYDVVLKKTSRGYVVLKSIIQEYKQKGLLPSDFPVKTLKEVITLARSLDKLLEQKLFNEIVDYNVLAGLKEFNKDIGDFVSSLKMWRKKYLSTVTLPKIDENIYYELSSDKSSTKIIDGPNETSTLEHLIKNNINKLDNNQAFGKNRKIKTDKNFLIKTNIVSFDSLNNIKDFYVVRNVSEFEKDGNPRVGVNFDEILKRIRQSEKDFIEQSTKISDETQRLMNKIIKDESLSGIGFEPTIRNLVGIVLANADTYIRLLKDVHLNAFNIADERKKIIKNFSDESVGESIYPWPEIKKQNEGSRNNVLVYPGTLEMIPKLFSNDKRLWPEIDFVENFQRISTNKEDNLDQNQVDEVINYIFETDIDKNLKKDISTFTYLSGVVPYFNKTLDSILYEIWERGKYITMLDSFNNKSIIEIAMAEYENLENQINEDYDLISILNEKIKSVNDLESLMIGISPFLRYPYLQDQLPTTEYIKNTLEKSYLIEKFVKDNKTSTKQDSFPNLKENLRTYISEEYRTKIYPFNSSTYLSYINKKSFTKNELKVNNLIQINTIDGFLTSPISNEIWIKDNLNKNLFYNTIKFSDQRKHILNTPYFHKQIYSDFFNERVIGKYASSAYLLLNSLPFKDLDDTISYDGKSTLMSSLFREINATHFIPYHLILKWGSIYHRYKTYINDGVDIIEDIAKPIDGDLFFDNMSGRTYYIPTGILNNILTYETIERTPTNKTNIGVNPFYHSIFHEVVNTYTFFDPLIGPDSYTQSIVSGILKTKDKSMIDGLGWTSFVDNSKFDIEDKRYTLLPSNGFCEYPDLTDYYKSEQENYRILWESENQMNIVTEYSGVTFPSYNQYFKDITNEYLLSSNNKKVLDLIATFKPEILEEFETMFLDFASKKLNEETEYNPYNVKYYNFQIFLKSIVSVDKLDQDSTTLVDELTRKIQERQTRNLENITNDILNNNNLIKLTISNSKEIDAYYLGGYVNSGVENFSVNPYNGVENTDLIELYLGEDMDAYYQDFFSMSDIEMSEENILNFRFIIYIYAGYIKAGYPNNRTSFNDYLKNEILEKKSDLITESKGQTERFKLYLNTLINQFKNLKKLSDDIYSQELNIDIGYGDDILKLELYNLFKSFNDKWIAGNSIGQKLLLEEFLFLDKANMDIGDIAYLDMRRIVSIMDQPNKSKMSLYNVLNLLIKDSGFDIRVLPAYVNFYGTNLTRNKNKIMPSKTVAGELFGTFLDVDYRDSTPKAILQYIGPTSKHLDLTSFDKKYKYNDDGVDISNTTNNPIIITPEAFRDVDFNKSNKVVAFEVSFGDQNQSMFKDIQLDQSSVKNTTESFEVLERMGNSEAGSSTAQIDIGLFDIYRQVSYGCDVTSMGNAMIQPTMFFHLKNVPMFKGSYWITEVSHTIVPGKFETTFKGSRIPLKSLPNPKDSFMASYRTLFDNLVEKSVIRVKEEQEQNKTSGQEKVTQSPSGQTVSQQETSTPSINKEKDVGAFGETPYRIPYNGFLGGKCKMITYGGTGDWLKAIVVTADSSYYPIDDNTTMTLLSKYSLITNQNYIKNKEIYWSDIKNMIKSNNTNLFYITDFRMKPSEIKEIIDKYDVTEFLNPNTNIGLSLGTDYNFDKNVFFGPINSSKIIGDFGIALSTDLMKALNVYHGQIIYFRLKSSS